MKRKITLIIIAIFSAFALAIYAPLAPVSAEDYSICKDNSIPDSIKAASGCDKGGAAEDSVPSLTDTIQTILNSIILVLGSVAVIFIVIGGVNYMMSNGDSGKLKKAKDTILYAIIGLIISVLAFAITNFTISIINGATSAEETSEEKPGTGGAGGGDGGSTNNPTNLEPPESDAYGEREPQ